MSGFSRQWLQLREPADSRSRADFSPKLACGEDAAWTIADLGCGTGANLRFLMPRLRAAQRWLCIDNDAELLDSLRSRNAARHSTHVSSLSTHQIDLATDIGSTVAMLFDKNSAGDRLVTASALLDLVSQTWVDELAAACTQAGASAWLALTYDGRIEMHPALPEDAALRSLVNAHQLRDKGFGAALGPFAHTAACKAFEEHRFELTESKSDWVLTCADTELQHALIAGWLATAREQSGNETIFERWMALRRAQLDAGKLEIRVGHRDLLARPRTSA